MNGLQIPLSISAAHFNDVPRNHPDFKFIETLYNHSTQSHEPFLKYEVQRETGKPTKVLAHPDQEISTSLANKIISGLLTTNVVDRSAVQQSKEVNLTRGEAAQLIYQYLKP